MTPLARMKAAVGRMAAVVAELDRPVTQLVEINAALEKAFRPKDESDRIVDEVLEELHLCGYCGEPCDGRWCSSKCRQADAYDGQHEEER